MIKTKFWEIGVSFLWPYIPLWAACNTSQFDKNFFLTNYLISRIGSELPKLKTAFYESHFPHCAIGAKTQCPRTKINKRFLLRAKTTTAWKLIPHRSKISKNWNPPHWDPLHRFFKNWFSLIQKLLYSNYVQTHFTK